MLMFYALPLITKHPKFEMYFVTLLNSLPKHKDLLKIYFLGNVK